MATRPEALESNGPPARSATIVRRVEVAEEGGSRIMSRHLPAWVISGALHVVLIGFFVLALSGPKEVEAKPADPLTTRVEEPREDDPVLTVQEVGFDPNLAILMSGIGTLIFFVITGGRVPSYLGSSFAFIGVVIAASAYGGKGPNGSIGLALGGIIACGIVYAIIGPTFISVTVGNGPILPGSAAGHVPGGPAGGGGVIGMPLPAAAGGGA